jgi:hypothetical protein
MNVCDLTPDFYDKALGNISNIYGFSVFCSIVVEDGGELGYGRFTFRINLFRCIL